MIKELTENRVQSLWKSWLFLAVILLFVVIVRVRLLGFPLERDEGEYAYMGQLILQGVPPYLGAYNMKFPGTYALYAFIMSVFGQDIQGIHLGFLFINCITVLLVFLLARKVVAEGAALAASAAYALLSLSPSVLGFAAHATHFVVLSALGGVLLLLFALRNKKGYAYFLSGVLFGVAILMKQPGLFFFLFGAIYILYYHFSLTGGSGSKTPLVFPPPSAPPLKIRGGRGSYDLGGDQGGGTNVGGGEGGVANSPKGLAFSLGMFIFGGAAPLLLTGLYLYLAGAFDRFWFWTIEYASKYGTQVPLSAAFGVFKTNASKAAGGFSFLWVMAVFGFIVTFFYKGMKGKKVFVVLFALFSFLTICPGFYFRSHYFVTLLPALSLLIGICIEWIDVKSAALFRTRYAGFAGMAIFLLAAGAGMASQRDYLFEKDPVKLSRTVYGANPFPESIEIARFIKAQSLPADRVAVFGSEPEIFFYAGRHSATGYIYVYGLMERHEYSLEMQQEMIREVMSSSPKFIVVVKVATSWLMRPDSERYMFGRLEEYVSAHYVLVGVADIISDDMTVYRWYRDAQEYAVQSPYHVLVFEKTGK